MWFSTIWWFVPIKHYENEENLKRSGLSVWKNLMIKIRHTIEMPTFGVSYAGQYCDDIGNQSCPIHRINAWASDCSSGEAGYVPVCAHFLHNIRTAYSHFYFMVITCRTLDIQMVLPKMLPSSLIDQYQRIRTGPKKIHRARARFFVASITQAINLPTSIEIFGKFV